MLAAVHEASLLMERYFPERYVHSPMVVGGDLFVVSYGTFGPVRFSRLSSDGTDMWWRDAGYCVPVLLVAEPVVVATQSSCSPSDPDVPPAYDATTGDFRWRMPGWGVVFADGLLFSVYGSPEYDEPWNLYATDPVTGAAVWTYGPFDDGMSWSVVSGGVVYVVVGTELVAVDAATGTELWTESVEGKPLQNVRAAARGVLLLEYGAYVAGAEWGLLAYDTRSRSVLWSHEREYGEHPISAVGGGRVLLCCRRGRLRAFDLLTGDLIWARAGRFHDDLAAVVTGAGAVVYAYDYRVERVLALKARNGALMRSFPGYGPAIVADGKLYIGSTENVLRVWG